MKVTILLLVVCLVAAASAQYRYRYDPRYEPGFRAVPGGVAAPYSNEKRQEYVNHVARHVGSGTGTARYYGVPGTDGYYGYGYNTGYRYYKPYYRYW